MIKTDRTSSKLALGIRANLSQFILLVIVNAFVGAMVGMERSILPAIPAFRTFKLSGTND